MPRHRYPSVTEQKLESGAPPPSLVAQTVKRLSTMRETWVQSLGWEDSLEKEMATHSSILALKIPWMEELGVGYYPWGHKESGTTEQLHFTPPPCSGVGVTLSLSLQWKPAFHRERRSPFTPGGEGWEKLPVIGITDPYLSKYLQHLSLDWVQFSGAAGLRSSPKMIVCLHLHWQKPASHFHLSMLCTNNTFQNIDNFILWNI